MNFDWDEQKNQKNISKHGLDFRDAIQLFEQPMLTQFDGRDNYGEDRYSGIGFLESRVVVIIYTEPDHETIRIISLRKALSYERRRFEQYLKNRLGKG
ncbi:MAG: BrnT family toxin [Synechocystis sp.]|nr:BrnT family toxin [Synechocystis sp.]